MLFYTGKLRFSRAVMSNRNIIQATCEIFYSSHIKKNKKEYVKLILINFNLVHQKYSHLNV